MINKILAIGIICAKKNSIRFPGKNSYYYNGEPMFYHSVKPLQESKLIKKVYVSTDSDKIANYCNERNIDVIRRKQNVIGNEEPLLSVLKYSYQTLEFSSEYICTIMANCPGQKASSVDKAINLIKNNDLNEVRSFNNQGIESGLIILKENILLNSPNISSHLGMVRSNIKEIHYKKDIL